MSTPIPISVVFDVLGPDDIQVGWLGPWSTSVVAVPRVGDSVWLNSDHPYSEELTVSAGTPGEVVRISHGLGFEDTSEITVFVRAHARAWPPTLDQDITQDPRWSSKY